jgi:carbamoyl-phosphate synthase small subunit
MGLVIQNLLTQVQESGKTNFKSDKPLFGICLGHQIIGLANGISTYKMFNGHQRNQSSCKKCLTGKGEITSQNHGFAVE